MGTGSASGQDRARSPPRGDASRGTKTRKCRRARRDHQHNGRSPHVRSQRIERDLHDAAHEDANITLCRRESSEEGKVRSPLSRPGSTRFATRRAVPQSRCRPCRLRAYAQAARVEKRTPVANGPHHRPQPVTRWVGCFWSELWCGWCGWAVRRGGVFELAESPLRRSRRRGRPLDVRVAPNVKKRRSKLDFSLESLDAASRWMCRRFLAKDGCDRRFTRSRVGIEDVQSITPLRLCVFEPGRAHQPE